MYRLFAVPLALALSGHALAQTPPDPQPNAAPPAATSPAQSAGDFRTSKLIGTDIFNNANENVGEIQDVLVKADGSATGVVLSVGGFLGMGERYVSVPMTKLNISRNSDNDPKIMMDATKDSLKAMPEYKFIAS